MTSTLEVGVSAEVDAALADLTAGAADWARMTVADRRDLLDRLIRSVTAASTDWVAAARAFKGLDASSPLVGEEWTSGPYAVLNGLAALRASADALDHGRSPVDGFAIEPAPGDRVAVRVLPHGIFDRLLLNGFTAQVWMPPGISAETVKAEAGLGLRRIGENGGVGVVLGAGNITSIPPLDVLYELFAHNRTVALKLNPVTDPLRPAFEEAFAPLIELSLLRILTGGADVGTYLNHHAGISHVHLTGSAATHNAIVFGTGAEGAERRAEGITLLDKEITSELGGVSPIIVVPGKWSKADLRFQAEHVVTQRLHNGGYNCIAGQVLILSNDWPQKDAFLDEIRNVLARVPRRLDFYPGSAARVADAKAEHPAAEDIAGRLLIIAGAPSDGESALTTEYFAPVLVVTQLQGQGSEFLRAAVRAANENFTGTLGANVIIHPATLAAAGKSFARLVADLRYGAIGINVWTGLGFLTAGASWGGYPGATIADVQSGTGVVHNALLLNGPERTVVTGPFRPFPRSFLNGDFALSPRPPWFVTNKTAAVTGRRLAEFAARPSWAKLPGIFASALRG